ncbi:MAG: hypothetical protein ACOYL6_18910 [Bacteriovoracaceae bacterium]
MNKILLGLMVLGNFSNGLIAETLANESSPKKDCSISINITNLSGHASVYADAVESYAQKKGYTEVSRNLIPGAHRIGFEDYALEKVLNRNLPNADVNIDLIPVAPNFHEYMAFFLHVSGEKLIRESCRKVIPNHKNDQGQWVENTGANVEHCVKKMIKSAKRLIPKCN